MTTRLIVFYFSLIYRALKEFVNQGFVRSSGPSCLSIVSLINSLRGQLVKCFATLLPNTLKFFVEKIREAFAAQKLLIFFQQKYWHI